MARKGEDTTQSRKLEGVGRSEEVGGAAGVPTGADASAAQAAEGA